jgi:hypothetical protein
MLSLTPPWPSPLKGEGICGCDFLPFSSFPGESGLMKGCLGDILPSPFTRAVMVGKREYQQPRVPFGHPGLAIRHPLRGLGGEGLDSMNMMPAAIHNRLQFCDITLAVC